MTKTLRPFTNQGYINVSGGRIWYGIVGELTTGNTPLLAIHGGPGMSHDYLFPLSDLSNDRAVIFYDQLDAGKSDRINDPANWNIDRFVSEINNIRETLGLTEVSIFGNSWGGTIAAAYASTQSTGLATGLKKLVLSSPLINTRRWIKDNHRYREALPEDIKTTMERCEANDEMDSKAYQQAVDYFYKQHLCRVEPWPDYLLNTFDVLNESCYQTMWGPNEFTCSGLLENYDGTASLSSIEVSTLMTCGEFDEATPTSCKFFANKIPGAELIVFENTSHLAFVEDRESYIATLREFLSK